MLPAQVADDELVARFIRNSSDMRPDLGRPRYSALIPPRSRGDMSVCRAAGLSDSQIRAIGTEYVEQPPQVLKGYCLLSAQHFRAEHLDVVAAPHPFPAHANVVGWPPDEDARLIAKRLADLAHLVKY